MSQTPTAESRRRLPYRAVARTPTRPAPGLLRAGRPELYDDPVMPGADMYDRRPPPPPRR